MVRPTLKELLKRAENKPETTLLLSQALENPENTLRTFYFTPSIDEYFEKILEQVATGKGGGFWVQAEYGAGKTHFLEPSVAFSWPTLKFLGMWLGAIP